MIYKDTDFYWTVAMVNYGALGSSGYGLEVPLLTKGWQ